MRTLATKEVLAVSGGTEEEQMLADLDYAISEADKSPSLEGRLGRIYFILETLGYAADAIDWLLSKIPRQDDLGNGGYKGYGLGSPGDGTVPGDPIGGGCSSGGSLIIGGDKYKDVYGTP